MTHEAQSSAYPYHGRQDGRPHRAVAVCLVLALPVITACVDPTPFRVKLDDGPLPVTVKALVTANRNVVSKDKMVTYGTWQVSFHKEPPTASSACYPSSDCEVVINALMCARGEAGASLCALHFDRVVESCALVLQSSDEKLDIACPVDIILDKPREPNEQNVVLR